MTVVQRWHNVTLVEPWQGKEGLLLAAGPPYFSNVLRDFIQVKATSHCITSENNHYSSNSDSAWRRQHPHCSQQWCQIRLKWHFFFLRVRVAFVCSYSQCHHATLHRKTNTKFISTDSIKFSFIHLLRSCSLSAIIDLQVAATLIYFFLAVWGSLFVITSHAEMY